jgi:hypothetical protein
MSCADDALRLGVLVETSGVLFSNKSIVGAVALAVAAANEQADSIGGRHLDYVVGDGGCDASNAAAALTKLLSTGDLDAVIGPGCSSGCESTAWATAGARAQAHACVRAYVCVLVGVRLCVLARARVCMCACRRVQDSISRKSRTVACPRS